MIVRTSALDKQIKGPRNRQLGDQGGTMRIDWRHRAAAEGTARSVGRGQERRVGMRGHAVKQKQSRRKAGLGAAGRQGDGRWSPDRQEVNRVRRLVASE